MQLGYRVLHKLGINSGQGMEGVITEEVFLESDFPDLVRCGRCGNVGKVKIDRFLYEDEWDSVVHGEGGPVPVDREPNYKKDGLQQDLSRVLDTFRVESLGVPRRT
jgi:hypothetical protein